MSDMFSEYEEIWEKYTKCQDYMDKKGYVHKSDLHWNMYLGEQWYHQGVDSENARKLPVVNFIEPIVNYKTATLCKKSLKARFSDTDGRHELNTVYSMLNDNFVNSWSRANMDNVMWSHVKSAAVTGASFLYFYGSDTKDVQVLPHVNVLLGDELTEDVQDQPYIMIRERVFAKDVRRAAEMNGLPEDMWKDISADNDDEYLTVNKDDIENTGKDGKITSVIYFEKRNGTVFVGRAVKGLMYEPLHPIDGLTKYPIISFVWQDKPNSARGQGEVVKHLRNQIEVNKTYARRSVIVKMFSYPIRVYNTNMVENPEDLKKTGISIGVNAGADNVQKAVAYISPATMSPDAKNLSDDLISTTRDLAGAGDTSMGQIDPTRVSGTAIVAINEQASLTLNEQLSKLRQCVSDIAEVWFDMWLCYNPAGLRIKRRATDEERMINPEIEFVPDVISIEQLKMLKPEIRIDVSENTQWAMNDRQTALDNLLASGYIMFDEYLDCLEEDGVLPKTKLMNIIKARPAPVPIMPDEQMTDNQTPQ